MASCQTCSARRLISAGHLIRQTFPETISDKRALHMDVYLQVGECKTPSHDVSNSCLNCVSRAWTFALSTTALPSENKPKCTRYRILSLHVHVQAQATNQAIENNVDKHHPGLYLTNCTPRSRLLPAIRVEPPRHVREVWRLEPLLSNVYLHQSRDRPNRADRMVTNAP